MKIIDCSRLGVEGEYDIIKTFCEILFNYLYQDRIISVFDPDSRRFLESVCNRYVGCAAYKVLLLENIPPDIPVKEVRCLVNVLMHSGFIIDSINNLKVSDYFLSKYEDDIDFLVEKIKSLDQEKLNKLLGKLVDIL